MLCWRLGSKLLDSFLKITDIELDICSGVLSFSFTPSGSGLATSLAVTGRQRSVGMRGKKEEGGGRMRELVTLSLVRCTVAPIKWVAYDTDIECSKPEKFGMYHGQPCIMIKLNKVGFQ